MARDLGSLMTPNTLILLPAFNEAETIEGLLRKIAREAEANGWSYRIIVGDDGSSDGTADILERMRGELPLEVVTHKINRGLGETSRDLFERAAELADDRDVIIRMDCDDTHEPEYMARMAAKLDEGFDVVVASRFQPGGGQLGVNAYRAFVSRCANLFMKVFFPIEGLREYTCGYRCYRGAVIRRAVGFYGNHFIQLLGLGFTCTLEKVVKLKMLGARFGEVPFVLRYDQKQSTSKMVSSITTLGYLVMAIVYYWPFSGWRRAVKRRLKTEVHG